MSYQSIDKINKYKNKLSYNDEGFTIHSYSEDETIKWETVEAIFMISPNGGEGTYHNLEYRIFLNKAPEKIRNSPLKWYNKVLYCIFKENNSMRMIDDYHNIHFNTFRPAVEKYLTNGKTTKLYHLFDRGNPSNDNGLIEYRKYRSN